MQFDKVTAKVEVFCIWCRSVMIKIYCYIVKYHKALKKVKCH